MNDAGQRKIKVLVVAASLRHVGGQSVQAARIVEGFAGDERVEAEFLPNDPDAPFRGVPVLRTIFTSLAFWWLLLTKVPRADVVHVFSSGTTSYVISTLPALFFARLFGRKVLLNYHNGALAEHLETWRTAAPTMRWFDKIVVPSEYLVDVYRRFDLDATSVFNTVDTARFAFRERDPIRPNFLSNRNFEAHYNVSDVLRAFAVILAAVPGARLVLAGYGSEETALKVLADELGLDGSVEFAGRVTNDEMAGLYDASDIYLNASVVDNMPLSFIEAFAAGLPVVSYATGGIPYIVDDGRTGRLVPTGDVAALATAALEMVEDPQKSKIIVANARAEVVKYEWENVGRQWFDVYAELAR